MVERISVILRGYSTFQGGQACFGSSESKSEQFRAAVASLKRNILLQFYTKAAKTLQYGTIAWNVSRKRYSTSGTKHIILSADASL